MLRQTNLMILKLSVVIYKMRHFGAVKTRHKKLSNNFLMLPIMKSRHSSISLMMWPRLINSSENWPPTPQPYMKATGRSKKVLMKLALLVKPLANLLSHVGKFEVLSRDKAKKNKMKA